MKNLFLFFLFAFYDVALAQTIIHVNANDKTTPIPPIWRDHYENHFLEGYGGNPALTGNHRLYTTDPSFYPAMEALKPRFIRISIGRVDNPSTTNYSSTNTNILRNLKYEFYKGRNTMVDANDLSNYNFSFIDSAISQIQSLGAEPFITMDYMPFTLTRYQRCHQKDNYLVRLSIQSHPALLYYGSCRKQKIPLQFFLSPLPPG